VQAADYADETRQAKKHRALAGEAAVAAVGGQQDDGAADTSPSSKARAAYSFPKYYIYTKIPAYKMMVDEAHKEIRRLQVEVAEMTTQLTSYSNAYGNVPTGGGAAVRVTRQQAGGANAETLLQMQARHAEELRILHNDKMLELEVLLANHRQETNELNDKIAALEDELRCSKTPWAPSSAMILCPWN
jgi:hypothetical protein